MSNVSKPLINCCSDMLNCYLSHLPSHRLSPEHSGFTYLVQSVINNASSYYKLVADDVGFQSLPVLMRTIFESFIYLEILFNGDQGFVNAGRAYYYSSYQNDVTLLLAYQKACTDNNIKYDRFLNEYKSKHNQKCDCDYFNNWRQKFYDCFNLPEYEGDPAKGFTNKVNKNTLLWTKIDDISDLRKCPLDDWDWFNFDGKSSSFASAVKLSHRPELAFDYALIYKLACGYVHSNSIKNNYVFKNNHFATRYPHDSEWDRFIDWCLIMIVLETYNKFLVNKRKSNAFAIRSKALVAYDINHNKRYIDYVL